MYLFMYVWTYMYIIIMLVYIHTYVCRCISMYICIHFPSQSLYIGPMSKTIVHFWHLVWQERPPTIVMVTNLKEGKKTKCQQYWPESGSAQSFGPFKVTLSDQQVYTDYVVRTLQLEVKKKHLKVLFISIFHFTF